MYIWLSESFENVSAEVELHKIDFQLADFGLLRLGVSGGGDTVTRTQSVRGTLAYMPPGITTFFIFNDKAARKCLGHSWLTYCFSSNLLSPQQNTSFY
jgi:hypothetical protein